MTPKFYTGNMQVCDRFKVPREELAPVIYVVSLHVYVYI